MYTVDKFMGKIKPWLCGDYWFGNLFFFLWDPEKVECPCCVFFRGVIVGMLSYEILFKMIPSLLGVIFG